MEMRRSPTITLLKDVVFPFLSHQGDVGSFKAPLKERVSVPGRDEKGTVLAVAVPRGRASMCVPPWLFGRYPLGLSTCPASLVLWGSLRASVWLYHGLTHPWVPFPVKSESCPSPTI